MTEPVRAALAELSGKAVTAIVSGRSLDDLRVRVDGVVPHMIGNHGWRDCIHLLMSCTRPRNVPAPGSNKWSDFIGI